MRWQISYLINSKLLGLKPFLYYISIVYSKYQENSNCTNALKIVGALFESNTWIIDQYW